MKKVIFFILFLGCLTAFGQTETHDFINYDTTIAYVPAASGAVWQVAIWRPRNYFTAGNTDTVSRRMVITMQGEGEVGTPFLNHYGPNYWLNTPYANGSTWNGGVTIGNGTHYPIYVTIQPAAANVRPNYQSNLIHTLINEFHPRYLKIDAMGLSMGNQCNVWTLIDSTTTGSNTMMNYVESLVDQEGENGSSYGGGYTSTFPSDMGTWASKGGKFLGLEGDADDRQVWQNSVAMNTAVAGSAYFSYQNFGGGGHGSSGTGNDGTSIDCWNYWWDVRTIDLTSTNSNITWTYNNVAEPHTLGTYTGPPENILQWVLRQGDTTLVGQGNYAYYYPQDAAGEYIRSELKNQILYTITDNSNLSGTTSWVSGVTDSVTTAGVRFIGVWPGLHTTYAIDNTANANLYAFGSNNMGQCGQGNTTATIQTPSQITQDSLGHPFINIAGVASYYCANNAEGAFIWKKNNDTLYIVGRSMYAIRGDGTWGAIATVYPTAIFVSPDGTPIRKVIAGQHVIVLTWGGNCYGWGGVNTTSLGISLQDVGTNASGTSYLTAAQIPISHVQDIAGGLSFNFYYDSSNHIWSNGYWGEYQGSTNGNWHPAVPTKIDSLIYPYMDTAAISFMGSDLACTHIISAKGTMYGFGDNASGNIGDGNELNFALSSPGGGSTAYSWDFGRAELPVFHPEQITDKHNWVSISYNTQFGLHCIATDATGLKYSWGRGKGAVLANKTVECSATIGADLPNSFDVTAPKLTANVGTITGVTTAYTASCPGCRNGVLIQADSPCNTCSYGTVTPPTANAGYNQTISTTSTTISAAASTDPVQVINYKWVDLSGLKSYITLTQNVTTTVDSLANGVHTMQLTVYNPGGDSAITRITITVGAQTRFYFDNTGSDTNACTLARPCASITKAISTIAAFTNNAGGDTVSFADGSTFYGELVIGVSGTPGHPYVFNNYNSGGGPIPIITGMTTLSTWTSLGGNKYETYCPQCNLSIPENDVVIDGKKAQIARWPNSGWWQYQTTSVDSGITITQLSSGSPNFVGSQLVMRANNYDIQTNVITYQGNDTVKFAWANNSNIVGTNNYGCFFRNTPVGLDTNNAWYFNKTTDSLVVYLTTTPSGHVIMASTVDTIVNANYKQYLTGDSLELDGGNRFGLLESGYYGGGDNLWENCKFKYHGTDAIFASSNFSTLPTITVTHSNFSDIGNSSLYVQGAGFGTVFTWDSVWRVGNVPGDGLNGVAYGYDALVVSEYGDDILNHNFFLHTGGAAIYWNEGTGSSALGNDSVCYNYSDSALEILEDLGAIYSFIGADTVSHAGQESYVLYNIVLNSRGNAASRAPTSGNLAMGIYGDAGTDHVNYSYNFIYGSGNAGINASEDHECKYTHNTIINCDSAQFAFYDHSAAQDVTRNDTAQYNILTALQSTQACIRVYSYEDSVQRYGIIDSNYYSGNAGAPLFEVTVNNAASPSFGNYAFWQSYATQDVGSGLFQNVVYWAYDSLPTPITVTIPAGIYKDVFNTTYSGTVTIQPYSSIALLLVSPGCNCLQLNKNVSIQ